MKITCMAYWTERATPSERYVAWIDKKMKHHIERIPVDEQIEACFVYRSAVRVEMTGLHSWHAMRRDGRW
jgi:hypothetical protein